MDFHRVCIRSGSATSTAFDETRVAKKRAPACGKLANFNDAHGQHHSQLNLSIGAIAMTATAGSPPRRRSVGCEAEITAD